jgi:type II secretory pathway component GspD/PulD (secretin)
MKRLKQVCRPRILPGFSKLTGVLLPRLLSSITVASFVVSPSLAQGANLGPGVSPVANTETLNQPQVFLKYTPAEPDSEPEDTGSPQPGTIKADGLSASNNSQPPAQESAPPVSQNQPTTVEQAPPVQNKEQDAKVQESAAPSSKEQAITTEPQPVPLAQSIPDPTSKPPAIAQSTRLPQTTISGTVTIHKRFKLFTREELIHNLSFRDALVREVIAELARRGNLNVIIDKSVTGKITGDLHDVTLNEAMENVLAAAGLQSRELDGSTVFVASPSAMMQLGLNRPMARAFKLSYASPFEVAQILHASVFNKGILPDFINTVRRQARDSQKNDATDATNDGVSTELRGVGEGGAAKTSTTTDRKGTNNAGSETDEMSNETTLNIRPDGSRSVRGSVRTTVQEGTGFNSASTDPGSIQIRAFQETNFDYPVEQNGGGAVVIPDARNRQVIIVGTADDINVADQAIRLLDRRPKEIHIQASLVELTNEGIRQIGASINTQGEGASASIMGNAGNPLVQFLPGLGSTGNIIAPAGSSFTSTATQVQTAPPPAETFSRTSTLTFSDVNLKTQPTDVTSGGPGAAFTGLIGSLVPAAPAAIAGVAAATVAQSSFNFLTLSKRAGGRANIATLPAAFGINVNLLLQTNKAKIIANPSVVVVDNTEALITIATEVIHKVTSTISLGVVSTNVELTKAGIFLDVLPKVTEDGFITMRLRPSVTAPTGPVQRFASDTVLITTLSYRDVLSQQVRVKDGQTLVLGGLFSENEAANLAKVPYLAEAPLLGAFFRNTLKGRHRTELMLLLTPKIVEDEPPMMSETTNGGRQM